MAKHGSNLSIVAAIVANILIGIVKFIAATISGSAAMFSEGIHSVVDSGNGLLILLGKRRAKKKPDMEHPFGYGKELYLWTLIVSILVFSLGGGMAITHGYDALMRAMEGTYVLYDPTMNYVVLLIAMALEGSSLFIAVRQFNEARRKVHMTAGEYIRESKDPSLYTVVLEDLAAEIGLLIAFIGTALGHALGNPYIDGIASIMIGGVLIVVAAVLMKESTGLLVGEGMAKDEVREIQKMVKAHPAIAECGNILTNYFGPENLLVSVDVTFKQEMDLHDVLDAIDCIEASVKKRFPQATRVYIEAESLASVRRQKKQMEELLNEE